MAGSTGGTTRNAIIDDLRGIAILMVLLLHFGETYGIWDKGPIVWLLGPNVAWALLGWGNYGVTVFFVVSGFLICTNAIERSGSLGRIDRRAFYARRVARILPSLLLALVVIVPLGLAGVPAFAGEPGTQNHVLLGAVSVLGFFHNVLMQRLGYFNYCMNVYWSLSVEEVFYLGLPLICSLLLRDALIVVPCLLLIVVAPFYRAEHADNDIFYLYANLACFDAIAIGCLTAMLSQLWRPAGPAAVAVRIFGALTLAAVWLRGFGGSYKILGFTYIALTTASIIISSLDRSQRGPVAWAPLRGLRWLGRHSYELYLFHIIVLAAMRDLVPGATLTFAWQMPWLAVYLTISCVAAGAIARWFGDPANDLLRQTLLPTRA